MIRVDREEETCDFIDRVVLRKCEGFGVFFEMIIRYYLLVFWFWYFSFLVELF